MKKLFLIAAVLTLPACSTIREHLPYQTAQNKADLYKKYESYTEAKLELIKKRKEYWEEQAQAEQGAE
jgi:hypothetical protein